jgi:V/A-type H+-transporting ATPase subunit E
MTEGKKMEDIQSLLEKINREGVEKAEAEAKRIVDAAKAKADQMLADARADAERARADAAKDAEASAARAAETIRQGARDVVIGVRESVTAMLEKLLAKDVSAALADDKVAAGLAAEAIRELAGPGEVACGEKLAQTLKAQLAAQGEFTVVLDDSLGAGFSVRTDGGRVEHSFSEGVIAAELAKRLRPDLAKLLS